VIIDLLMQIFEVFSSSSNKPTGMFTEQDRKSMTDFYLAICDEDIHGLYK
jgi:hypothetical protein